MKVTSLLPMCLVIFVYFTIFNFQLVKPFSTSKINENNEISYLETDSSSVLNNKNYYYSKYSKYSKHRISTHEDTKYLPFTDKKPNSEFEPIKIKFINVDGDIEMSKQNSAFTKDTYEAFYHMIMEPVHKYFKDFLKVYPLSKVKDAISQEENCLAMFKDDIGTIRKFKQNLKEALEDNVSKQF